MGRTITFKTKQDQLLLPKDNVPGLERIGGHPIPYITLQIEELVHGPNSAFGGGRKPSQGRRATWTNVQVQVRCGLAPSLPSVLQRDLGMARVQETKDALKNGQSSVK